MFAMEFLHLKHFDTPTPYFSVTLWSFTTKNILMNHKHSLELEASHVIIAKNSNRREIRPNWIQVFENYSNI